MTPLEGKCLICHTELRDGEKAFCRGPCRGKKPQGAVIVDQKKPEIKPAVVCKQCGEPMPKKPGPKTAYCSAECKSLAYKALGVEDESSQS